MVPVCSVVVRNRKNSGVSKRECFELGSGSCLLASVARERGMGVVLVSDLSHSHRNV